MIIARLAFWLLIAHFALDFPFQGDTMAMRKSRHCKLPDIGVPWGYWMTAHALMQAGGVFLILGNLPIAIGEFVAHFTIDCIKCEKWIDIHSDQLMHAACKGIWLLLLFPPHVWG